MENKAPSFPQSLSDWDRVDRMDDDDIDFSDLPEIPPESFARAIARRGGVLRQAQAHQPERDLLSDESFKTRLRID